MHMVASGVAAARMAPRDAAMQAQDIIWLAALGVAARRPVPPETPLMAIHDIAGSLWSPVADVVTACIREMLCGGQLEMAATFDQVQTTAHGLECLERLMGVPLPGPRSILGHVGLRLKLAHLDLVSADTRRRVLGELITDHQKELALARIDLGQIWAGHHGRAWFRGDAERLRRDLCLLRTLLAQEEGRGGDVVRLEACH